ncbi:MAG: hypothetical protein ACI8XV_000559 [Arenicella sp.]
MNKIILTLILCWSASIFAQVPGPTQQQQLDNRGEAINLADTRRKLDQLIWGPEVLAQQYEARIVRLWDDLLKAQDKFKVLADLDFNSLRLAAHQNSEGLQHQIARYTFSGDGESWGAAQWKAFIAKAVSNNYVLEQSEWHHSGFTSPQANQGAQSEVSFELHIARGEPAHRVILKGVLDVSWKVSLGVTAEIEPNDIVVTQMTIMERQLPPAFEEVFTVSGTEKTPLINPLLVYDLDKDGLSEIIVGGQNLLLRNNGKGVLTAEKLFDKAKLLYDGAVIADFSGDGQVDLVGVDNNNYPLLFKGNKDGSFNNQPIKMADTHLGLPKTFTAGDIDGDGDLDIHIGNYKYAYRQGQMPSPYYDANDGYPAVLLRNDGEDKFTDITDSSGLGAKSKRRSYSSSFVDFDDDQDMDLIVVSDYAGFDVYLNDGKGKFTDITDDFGLDRHFFGMGHTFDDFDGDGKLDFYVIGMSSTTARRLAELGVGRKDLQKHTEMRDAMGYGNRMFLKRENGFVKAPFNSQVARTGWSWGVSTFDFDNDGDKDIFIANGHYSGESTQDYCTTFWRHDIYEGGGENIARDMLFQTESTDLREANISWNGYEHKVLYLKHKGEYVNIAYLMGVAFEYDARSVVTEDIDKDGRPDLLVVEHVAEGLNKTSYRLHIYRNALSNAGHWVGVELSDSEGRSTIGAHVEVVTKTGKQFSRIVTGDSFSSQHSANLHFGLGAQTEINEIRVTWANGQTSSLKQPKVDKYHRLENN